MKTTMEQPSASSPENMTQPPHTTEQPKGEVWHSQSAAEVLAQLGSAATGLSAQAPVKRLAMVAMLVRLMDIVVLRRQPGVAKDPNNQPNGRVLGLEGPSKKIA